MIMVIQFFYTIFIIIPLMIATPIFIVKSLWDYLQKHDNILLLFIIVIIIGGGVCMFIENHTGFAIQNCF